MTGYDPSRWTDLFVASAGASAALAGLVFVAVSINLERILKMAGLPERALETVLLLLAVVLVSIIGLIPGQGSLALGVELLAGALVLALVIGVLAAKARTDERHPTTWVMWRLAVRTSGTVPFILGGITLIAHTGGGLYWTVAGIVLTIAGAVGNAWVLLVEIIR